MKKYFLAKDNKELKVGDKIKLIKPVKTSYGEGEVVTEVNVTEDILGKLVKDGFVRVEETDELEDVFEKLKPYIKRIARKNNIDFPTACTMLDAILKVSPRAELQLLIETVAEVKNRGKKPGEYKWFLSPVYGYYPVQIVGSPSAAIVFYEAQDAHEAYKILLPFIKDIVNE